jgi:Transposase DDE domain
MSHQDTVGHTGPAPHHQALRQALDWLLEPARLSDVVFRPECTWTPKGLIFAAILWAWSDEKTLTGRFSLARKVVAAMAILPQRPATTYQAFLKMLRAWTITLTVALRAAFRRRMRTDLADRFPVWGYDVFGVDGSRLELPRTQSNEQRFSPASAPRRRGRKPRRRARSRAARDRRAREKKINSPQLWLTTMFHVGTGLPWDWRVGPSDSSEREHLRQMIDALPAGALVTADAGFVGYETWKAILDSGRHLLIRVGANVRLLKGLGYVQEKGGLVYLWPDREAARNQPPLVLRLVVARGGRHPVYLVTSVLDEGRLSDKQVVEIYARAGEWNCSTAISSRRSSIASCAAMRRRMPSWRRTGRCWDCGRWACTPKWNWRARVSRHAGSAWPGCCVAIAAHCASTGAVPTPGNRWAKCCGRP